MPVPCLRAGLFIYLSLSISCAMGVCATPSIIVLVLLFGRLSSWGSCGLCVVLVALDCAFDAG